MKLVNAQLIIVEKAKKQKFEQLLLTVPFCNKLFCTININNLEDLEAET